MTGGVLLEVLRHIQLDTDVKDFTLLAIILESLVLDVNPYVVNQQMNRSDTTELARISEIAEKLGECGKLVNVQNTEFSVVIQELVSCIQRVTHLLQIQDDRLKLRIFLPLLGLINCLTSGKLFIKDPSEAHDSCLQRYASYFKVMKCTSQREFEEAYFYIQSLKLDGPWAEETFQHQVDKEKVINLIECCENIEAVLHPGVADVIFKQWKEQLADVAFLSTTDGVLSRKEIEDKSVHLPDINETLILLSNVSSLLPQCEYAEALSFSNAIKEIRFDIETMLVNTYKNSVQELKLKTAMAIVDLRWTSCQGMVSNIQFCILNLCTSSITVRGCNPSL